MLVTWRQLQRFKDFVCCPYKTHGSAHLLSLPGYICVYSTLNLLANSMKAFIGRLHLLAEALLLLLLPCALALVGCGCLERELLGL